MQKIKLKLTRTKNFEDFLSWCKVKNLRKPTVDSYKLAWDMFNRHYEGEIEDIEQSDVNAFVLDTHKHVNFYSLLFLDSLSKWIGTKNSIFLLKSIEKGLSIALIYLI
ncbi:MAG TPA: hypothetical protein DEP72_03980 [Clostridiales bacterium]|nr:MAG: hypothetical protein A2Y18_04255 [Clostridiales bacterium GWD2_32_19]HCC07305.1 hypothetical protein [Clostridiales bacterium]